MTRNNHWIRIIPARVADRSRRRAYLWFWEMAGTPQPFPETPWALDSALKRHPGWQLKRAWSWESGFYRHPIADLEYIRDWNLRALLPASGRR